MATASFDREMIITDETAINSILHDLKQTNTPEIDTTKTKIASEKGKNLLKRLFAH